MSLLEFGGVVFWVIIAVFLFIEAALLFNREHSWTFFPMFVFGVFVFIVSGSFPDLNYKWLLLYPLIGLIWLPTYWYLCLRRDRAEMRALVSKHGSVQEAGLKTSKVKYLVWEYGEGSNSMANRVYSVKFKHPDFDDLVSNAILWPISMPVFSCENAIKYTIDAVSGCMNRVRDNFSAEFEK